MSRHAKLLGIGDADLQLIKKEMDILAKTLDDDIIRQNLQYAKRHNSANWNYQIKF